MTDKQKIIEMYLSGLTCGEVAQAIGLKCHQYVAAVTKHLPRHRGKGHNAARDEEIRRRVAAGERQIDIAREYYLSPQSINLIVAGGQKLNHPQQSEMRQLRQQGVPIKDIAERYSISVNYAHRLTKE